MSTLLDNVAPGKRKLLELHAGQLPSGTPIRIRAHILRASEPGPVGLLLGGVHGDEINGVEVVRRAVAGDLHKRLLRGTIIAIPLLNVFGFLNYARYVPDGKDVNRSFPGSATGSLASRVAHLLTRHVLPIIDFGLDFHTGGRSHYNWPQTRHAPSDAAAGVLAKVFGAPVQLTSPPIAKSLRKTAQRLGVPLIIYEGGENLRINRNCIREATDGIERVLVSHAMIDAKAYKSDNPRPIATFGHHRWHRAKLSGLFEHVKHSGQEVKKREVIGYLRDPYGQEEHIIRAPRDAFIIGHDNSPVISQGDALFHLAW